MSHLKDNTQVTSQHDHELAGMLSHARESLNWLGRGMEPERNKVGNGSEKCGK